MAKQRVLYVSSNHPAIRPGGLEAYTLTSTRRSGLGGVRADLHRARRAAVHRAHRYHGWSPFAMVNDDPNQYLFYTDTFADLVELRRAVRQVARTRRS